MNIKELRENAGITQIEASEIVNIPLRTYKNYENDPKKIGSVKYNSIVSILKDKFKIDEEHGLLKLSDIKILVKEVLDNHNINFCYLFGSYAKGYAKDDSDIDLLIDGKFSGLEFFGIIEELRTTLKKKIDLLEINQLNNNLKLTKEILKDGIKIYG